MNKKELNNNEAVYLLEQLDFDDMENRFSNAISTTFLGYIICTEEQKNIELEKLKDKHKNILEKMWDGELYPKFYATKIKKYKLCTGKMNDND